MMARVRRGEGGGGARSGWTGRRESENKRRNQKCDIVKNLHSYMNTSCLRLVFTFYPAPSQRAFSTSFVCLKKKAKMPPKKAAAPEKKSILGRPGNKFVLFFRFARDP